eukprot:m.86165 g.86165  ORF g.86165 m.86165 type:complete len:283 (+) comp14866_c0_seq1:288-1136(+)
MPSVFMQLGLLLKENIELLRQRGVRGKQGGGGGPAGPPGQKSSPSRREPVGRRDSAPRTVLSRVSGSGLAGTVQVEGVYVMGAELRVDLPGKSSRSSRNQQQFVTSVSAGSPWLVTQLQDVLNILDLGFLELQDASQIAGATPTRHQAAHVIDRIIELLIKALRILQNADPTPPEQTVGVVTVLNPAPPHQMLVDMFVANASLRVCVTFVSALPGKPTGNVAGKGPTEVGRVFQKNGKWFEVTGRCESSAKVGSLAVVAEHLASMLELAQRTQDKLAVFGGV